MLRIGYTNIGGYSNFTIDEWKAKGQSAYQPEWAEDLFETGRAILDVRKPGEWKIGIADSADASMLELADLFKNVIYHVGLG